MTDPVKLAAALQSKLPLHAQHLAEPLAQYVVAAQALASAIDSPTIGEAVTAALAMLPQGGTLSFNAATIAGGVEIDHVAGGHIFNLTITTSPDRVTPSLLVDSAQEKLLHSIHKLSWANGRDAKSVDLANWLRWEHQEVLDEINALVKLEMVEITTRGDGAVCVRLIANGRKIVRALE